MQKIVFFKCSLSFLLMFLIIRFKFIVSLMCMTFYLMIIHIMSWGQKCHPFGGMAHLSVLFVIIATSSGLSMSNTIQRGIAFNFNSSHVE